MTSHGFRGVALALAVLAVAALAVSPVDGRPGGGESYSGGGSSGGGGGWSGSGGSSGGGGGWSGSGGSSGGGGGLEWVRGWYIIVLFFLVLLGCAFAMLDRPVGWDAGAVHAAPPPRIGPSVDAIRRLDPDLSSVLFHDFAYALYARAHQARHDPEILGRLAPYLSAAARSHLERRAPVAVPITAVVVGALRVVEVALPLAERDDTHVRLGLEYEANLLLAAEAGGEGSTQYAREVWRFTRAATARTRPWEAVRSLGCPACGASFAPTAGNRCAACGRVVDDGRFDWVVVGIDVAEVASRPPSLRGSVPERGTNRPTVLEPGVLDRWHRLLADDPALGKDGAAFDARLRLIFRELNTAWQALDLARARAYLSDAMYDHLRYWIEAYHAQGLRNVVDGARMTRWLVAKLVRDRHYDAVTVRVWGTGRDHTVETATGRVVGGDPATDRPYSEYWTLIRGAAVRTAPRHEASCPNCGAPLKVNMGGQCEYCTALLTRGDFDWVLSRIEQDDSYAG